VVFSSHIFIYFFLPSALLGYYALAKAPQRWRNFWLILAGYTFYGWGGPRFKLLMFATTSIDWFMSLIIAHDDWHVWRLWHRPVPRLVRGGPRTHLQRSAITTSIVCNLIALGFFKYFNFGVDTYNAVLRFTQNNQSADVFWECASSGSDIGVVPTFTVPQFNDGDIVIQIRTSVNESNSEWSAPVHLTVKNPS